MNTETMSRNAIRLWQMMNDGNTWNYRQLRQKSQLPDRDINAALGWLAHEETVDIIPDFITGEDQYKVRHFQEFGMDMTI